MQWLIVLELAILAAGVWMCYLVALHWFRTARCGPWRYS